MSVSTVLSRRAVVLGLSPAGLYLVREFADAGLEVIVVHDGPVSALSSRYVKKSRVFVTRDEGELERFLLELGEHIPIFPTSDRYIAFLSSRYALFSGRFAMPECYAPEHFSLFLDKEKFYAVCADAGVAFPKRILLSEFGGGETLGYPLLVKPGRLHEVLDVMAGSKVFRCSCSGELDRLRKKLPPDRGGWIVQEIVEGADTDIICIGGVRSKVDGRLRSLIGGRKLRQFPPGFGTASSIHIFPQALVPELVSAAEKLLSRLGLTGLFEIEFKRDRKDGVWKVFEVNPRSALWFQGARVAGVPLALEALGNAFGGTAREQGPESGPEAMPEVLWRAGLKDLFVRLYYLLRRNGERFPAPDRTQVRGARSARRAWAYGERGDRGPAVREFFSLFRKAIGRIL